jgi:hypothetical protein
MENETLFKDAKIPLLLKRFQRRCIGGMAAEAKD